MASNPWSASKPPSQTGIQHESFVKFHPLIHACETVDQTLVLQLKKGLGSLFAMIKPLSKIQFDLQKPLRIGLITWSAHVPRKLGRADAREGDTLFCNEKSPRSDSRLRHALHNFLTLSPPLVTPDHPLPKTIADFLTAAPLLSNTGPVLMFPSSRRAEKKQPFFEKLTRFWLRQNRSIKIIRRGSEPACLSLPPKLGRRLLNFCTKNFSESLRRLIETFGLVIANDGDPMRLAAATSKQTLDIFAPASPALYGPYPPPRINAQVVSAPNPSSQGSPTEEVLRRAIPILTPR